MDEPEEVRLPNVLFELAIAVVKDKSLKVDLERLVRVTCWLMPGCSEASVSMLVSGQPSTVAASDRVATLPTAQSVGRDRENTTRNSVTDAARENRDAAVGGRSDGHVTRATSLVTTWRFPLLTGPGHSVAGLDGGCVGTASRNHPDRV